MDGKKYKKSLFIFRRDLRLQDNTGLAYALSLSDTVIPCFIFDPRQVDEKNPYRSENAIQFMIESLIALAKQLEQLGGKLYIFSGNADEVVKKLIIKEKIDAIFTNRDYTPFSLKRDEKIKHVALQNKCTFEQYGDLLLNEPEMIMTGNGTPYTIFTAYFNKARLLPVLEPQELKALRLRAHTFYALPVKGTAPKSIFKELLPKPNKNIHVHGGTPEGLKIVRSLSKFKNYGATHDIPSKSTTNLSAHLKFGTLSIRQAYHAIVNTLGTNHPLLRQLYWRDFFTYVAFHNPFVFGHPYHEKYEHLHWSDDKSAFKKWCAGKTGFPIVDAGMRQLNQTGFMHNRVRMIVASFLVKDLHINWLWGEKYFATKLVDYDPSVNNGNWQWCASTGCDAQPYFRIFNPWLQQKKFDAECIYIKRWIPELAEVQPKIIHALNKPKQKEIKGYPQPIVDHEKESKKSKLAYKRVKP